jgi:hypothetical protein
VNTRTSNTYVSCNESIKIQVCVVFKCNRVNCCYPSFFHRRRMKPGNRSKSY